MGVGSATVAGTPLLGHAAFPEPPRLPMFKYSGIRSLEDAVSAEGLVMVRLATGGEPGGGEHRLAGRIRVDHATVSRMKSYFFEGEDHISQDPLSLDVVTAGVDTDVVVLWLSGASLQTRIRVLARERVDFSLGELLESDEINVLSGGVAVKANFLLDKEIGEISLQEAEARETGDRFNFIVMADPQGGLPDDQEGLKTRMKIHNAFIEESVDLANKSGIDPLFAIVAGDVCDDWGYEKDLAQMNIFLSRLNCPVLYGIGNHETLLRSEFGPGYHMGAFEHFLAAQKAMNGLDKLLYSFNAGRWHFVVWPDPLRPGFWETHPHYFDWLERDLEKYRERPTMVFQHVPIQPVGITPHINYAESVFVKRTFLEILARQGNVRYVLSGHVHIPVRASFKTAVSMRGIRLINLPAAGYRPRAFGEEDYYGGPSQGVALVQVDGDRATIRFKTVTEELFEYPAELPDFNEKAYPLWLNHPWELPCEPRFRNGSFEQGLEHWAPRYVYREDEDPSNLCEPRPAPGKNVSALYLYCRRRGYQAPGQDRLPQDINRISQAVRTGPGSDPLVRFSYRVDGDATDPAGFSGGYVRVEAYAGSRRVSWSIYSIGKIWVNNWGARDLDRKMPVQHFDLPRSPDLWHEAELNVLEDYRSLQADDPFSCGKPDRLLVTPGVWNLNDGDEQPFGVYFTGFELVFPDDPPGTVTLASSVDGTPVREKDPEEIWWRNKIWPNRNIAGEHRYIIATQKAGV
jgi:hypothetical protein